MVCKHCGKEIDVKAKKCMHCGRKIKEVSVTKFQKTKTALGVFVGLVIGIEGFGVYTLIGGVGSFQIAVLSGNWYIFFSILAEIVLGAIAMLIGIIAFPSGTIARKTYLEALLKTLLVVLIETFIFCLGSACSNLQ